MKFRTQKTDKINSLALKNLEGLIVKDVIEVHDYLQVVLSDDTRLNIYNNYSYDGYSVTSIEGDEVISITETIKTIIFNFKGGGKLTVGMRDEDYNGPEAMELLRKGNPTVVWN